MLSRGFGLCALTALSSTRRAVVALSLSTSTITPAPPHRVLLVASRADVASLNLAKAVLDHSPWTPLAPFYDGGELSSLEKGGVHASLWLLNERMTKFDDVDKRFAAHSSSAAAAADEVIFLSRHAAESGRPSLTVHPIGTPSALRADKERFGGLPGRCPPPNLRMSSLLRRVKRHATASGLLVGSSTSTSSDTDEAPASTEKGGGGGGGAGDFEVSPEATHHGPWLETPACFCEIGSREEDWGRTDASKVWAAVLHEELFGGGAEENEENEEEAVKTELETVVIGIGGGHYCPKIADVIGSSPSVAVGHILPSYALAMEEGGDWESAVREAVRSTREAMDRRQGTKAVELVALVDKKAFKSTQKAMLLSLLEDLGVRAALKKNQVVLR